MRRIASWTQTYGNNRFLNMQLLQYDKIGSHIRCSCDYIIFSFHNCSSDMFEKSKEILEKIFPKDKLIIMTFNDCSYLDCYRNIVKKTNDLGCTDILQIQDDQHGINSKFNIENLKNIDDIVTIYRNNENIHFFHIFGDEGLPKPWLVTHEKLNYNEIEVYKFDSRDYKKGDKSIYSWNDGTYFINLNLINQLLHLPNIPSDVWHMELFLKYVLDNSLIYRWGTNQVIFKASNLFGRNVNRTLTVHDNLKRFFGETSDWDIIQSMIEM